MKDFQRRQKVIERGAEELREIMGILSFIKG
jgi:hypothetical protein